MKPIAPAEADVPAWFCVAWQSYSDGQEKARARLRPAFRADLAARYHSPGFLAASRLILRPGSSDKDGFAADAVVVPSDPGLTAPPP